VAAFGHLVRAEADPGHGSWTPEVARVQEGLEGLQEARARLSDLLTMDTGPVLFELHFALLSTVKRTMRELDLDERIRRQLRLHPPTPPLLTRAPRRRPRR
jgi:hypothetical protein